jgi:hypothetical protein
MLNMQQKATETFNIFQNIIKLRSIAFLQALVEIVIQLSNSTVRTYVNVAKEPLQI